MATRVGIELSPVACRIIEIDGGATRSGDVPETRVRSYAVLGIGSLEMTEHLKALRRRRAAVVVWGVKSDHRQLVVAQGGYDKMRAEALASARQAAVETDGMLSDIAPAGAVQEGSSRRPVLLAMAASRGISDAVQPLLLAGLELRSVVTPADALASLARTRSAFSPPETIEAYVVLEERATAVALVRDGALVTSRELPWGFLDSEVGGRSRPREDVAARLADALTEFFGEIGSEPASIRQISICGGLPELRSMTVQLMERLDVEVETLDSLFGIDTGRLPAPEQDFRDQSAELRLAWAVAADWAAPINLIRERNRARTRTTIARAAVVAGVVAGLALGWRIETSKWWQRTAPVPTVARATPPKALTSAKKPLTPAPPRPPQAIVTASAPPPAIAKVEEPARAGEVVALAPGAAKPGAPATPLAATASKAGAFVGPVAPAPTTGKAGTPPAAALSAANAGAKPVLPVPIVPPSSSSTPPSSARANTPALPPTRSVVVPAVPPPPVAKAASAPSGGAPLPSASTAKAATTAAPAVSTAKVAGAPASANNTKAASATPPGAAPAKSAAAVPPPLLPPKIAPPSVSVPAVAKAALPVKPPTPTSGPPTPSPIGAAASSARANPEPAPRAIEPAPRATPSPSRSAEAAPRPVVPPAPRLEPIPRTTPPATRTVEVAPRSAVPPPSTPEPAPRVPSPPTRAAEATPPPIAPPPVTRPPIAPAPVAAPLPRVTEPAPRPSELAAGVAPPSVASRPEPPPRAAGRQPAAPLPLDAVLVTILYSPDRKLAIVDGRIVGIGDDVKGAIVVDITASTVLLRDEQGRMRSLTLGGLGR